MFTRRQVRAVLQRERARADRNNLEFSLALFRVRADEPRLMARLARLLLRRSRAIDEIGWFDDTCIAALLPYTGAEGARIFCENTLKLAQDELVPAICRIYTYPNAWYFGEDPTAHHDNNNNGNNNNHSQPVVMEPVDADSDDEPAISTPSPSVAKLRREARDNSHAHERRMRSQRTAGRESVGRDNGATENAGGTDLMPFFLQGVSDGLQPPDAGAPGVEVLLVHRLPFWKRIIDLIGAGIGLLMLAPIMAIIAIAIKGTSKGPILFKQRRAGLGGQPFYIYKFRTMIVDAEQQKAALRKFSEQDGPAFKLTNDPRITRIGKFLRETSLDELPQLWNVLLGDMSLVGPRPLPMDESAACDRWQRRRLDVTPGLTCIWQVKGRSRVTFAELMRMDVNYIRRRTIWHDVKILAETIPAVLLRKGAR
jgi:lipopolysaccharide/colanic/teichoic acid biosynthesis glycosyltransferase